jgi:molybdenum cofactor cytidylyltransferase
VSTIAAIVLAAGSSSRFGPDNKLLRSFGGAPLVAHAVAAVRAAGADPIVVVTGHDAGAVRRALAEHRVTFIHNSRYEHGMGSSIAAGARAIQSASAILIALGDMPEVSGEHARALADAFDPGEPESICLPVFEGRRGHPVLFGAAHLDALRRPRRARDPRNERRARPRDPRARRRGAA